LPLALKEFRVHLWFVEPGEPGGVLTTGPPLSKEESGRLHDGLRAAKSLDEIVVRLVLAVREVAARDPTVSKNVLAISIPRKTVEQQTDGRAILMAGGSLTFDVLGSLYFAEDTTNPIQYGPNFVFRGTALTE
jgi:hypothetical protein